MTQIFETCSTLTCPHAFSTRFGGVSEGVFESLNLGCLNAEDVKNAVQNWAIFSKASKIDVSHLAMVQQVHKSDVLVVNKKMVGAPSANNYIGKFDGLVTNCPEVTLAVFTADCCPVLLYDKRAQVVGALHCGWKPLCADIIFEGIKKMQSLGSKPQDISAGIGPCINQCCFETGQEVIDGVINLIGNEANKCFVLSETCKNKFYVNLRKTVQIRLEQLGVPLQNISHINECTSCNNNKYFSYRAENGKTGRLANIIKLPDIFLRNSKKHKNEITNDKNHEQRV